MHETSFLRRLSLALGGRCVILGFDDFRLPGLLLISIPSRAVAWPIVCYHLRLAHKFLCTAGVSLIQHSAGCITGAEPAPCGPMRRSRSIIR
jgi:hypothetical protein